MAIGALVARCGDVRRPAALLGFGDADDRRIRRQGSAATGGGGREVFDVAAVRHFTGSSEVAAQVGTGWFGMVTRCRWGLTRGERWQLLVSVDGSVGLVRERQVGCVVVALVPVVVVTDGDVGASVGRRDAGNVQVERLQRTGQLDFGRCGSVVSRRWRPWFDGLVCRRWRRRRRHKRRLLEKEAKSLPLFFSCCVPVFRFQTQVFRFLAHEHFCKFQSPRC